MDGDSHFRSLRDSANISRRAFALTSLATGFAIGPGPVNAQAVITTDADGLVAGEVRVPVAGGEAPAYRAKPARGSGFGTVLVVHEVWGVHEHFKDVCRRFAKAGYYAISIDLFARLGNAAAVAEIPQLISTIVAPTPDAQIMADLDAAAAFAGRDGADATKLAITGFCWGGRIVWMYAAHRHGLKAGVAWYGPLNFQPGPARPRQPRDVAGELHAPVLGLYAGDDTGIPQDQVEQLRAALRAANSRSEIVVVPGVPHGFYADYRASYRADAARMGWDRMLDWFRRNGVTPASS